MGAWGSGPFDNDDALGHQGTTLHALAPPEGTEPVGRPAVYDRVPYYLNEEPVRARSLRAAYRVTDEDPLGVVRAWVELELVRAWVSASCTPVLTTCGRYGSDSSPEVAAGTAAASWTRRTTASPRIGPHSSRSSKRTTTRPPTRSWDTLRD